MVNRFVTPAAILQKARENAILERRQHGFVGPIGAIQLDTRDTIKAFLDYFDEMEEQGWLYVAEVTYPDLPYGGCYVFRKGTKTQPKKLTKIQTIDEQPIDEEIMVEEQLDEQVIDMYNEDKDLTDEEKEELMYAPSEVINEVLFRQQRVLNGEEEDPDKTSNLVDELAKGADMEQVKKDESPEVIRSELYKQFENENSGKHAVFRGKETQQFKAWLDEKQAEYDPSYKQFQQETGKLAISEGEEIPEFKEWFNQRFGK